MKELSSNGLANLFKSSLDETPSLALKIQELIDDSICSLDSAKTEYEMIYHNAEKETLVRVLQIIQNRE